MVTAIDNGICFANVAFLELLPLTPLNGYLGTLKLRHDVYRSRIEHYEEIIG